MEKGKIIVIEGTDCSGKETQSKKLINALNECGMETEYFGFPNYNSPTGKIVGLPFLGKGYIAHDLVYEYVDYIKDNLKKTYGDSYNEDLVSSTFDSISNSLKKGWFKEGAPNVDAKISSLYYAADRAYNINTINDILLSGKNVVLDRYIYSNLAHQGCKIDDPDLRKKMYDWNCYLEFVMMNLPESDVRLFLHMPTEYATFLRKNRKEELDENEQNVEYLLKAEKTYLEIAKMYNFETIECVKKQHEEIVMKDIRSVEDISREVIDTTKRKLLSR